MQLTNEHIHLRTAHSKLMGYWTTEYGGLNEVTHLWQYGMSIVCSSLDNTTVYHLVLTI
jgi:hypothetical protein